MATVLYRTTLRVVHLSPLLLLFCCAPLAQAMGKGPIGVWPASERYALLADTSLPGLVLVDLHTGAAVEQRITDNIRPVGVASCQSCRFVLISGGQKNYWLMRLPDTVSNLLQASGRLALSQGSLEVLDINTAKGKLTDGRMVLVSDDGRTAFVASSQDHVVARVDLSAPSKPNAVELFRDRTAKPFGLNWDRNGDLLLTMHKDQVLRMSAQGKVLAVYDVIAADCPGAREFNPNLRAAVDDPVHADSVLVLASNPRSYDAVVWRVDVDQQGRHSCVNVAGKIGREPGWIDASGEAVEFSRPHYFALRPDSQPPELILSDIDNRALRLLDLTTYATSSVIYNSVQAQQEQVQRSTSSCAELKWPLKSLPSASGEFQYCVGEPQSQDKQLTRAQAQTQCSAQGARLCAPAELQFAGIAPATSAWSAAECSSCWQRNAGERCVAGEDHKTHELTHSDKGFEQRWHSGHALVISTSNTSPAATVCQPVNDTLRAAAPCCADVRTAAQTDRPTAIAVGTL